ncbi:MAG: hypothetical protein P4L84_23550 [Isosphaeraceae bacterium]|nr:hypothetical protein [Isosphaeraceae bacterium]
MSQSRIEVEHVRLMVDKSFEGFTAAFEQQLGRFEPGVYQALEEGGDPVALRARLEIRMCPGPIAPATPFSVRSRGRTPRCLACGGCGRNLLRLRSLMGA